MKPKLFLNHIFFILKLVLVSASFSEDIPLVSLGLFSLSEASTYLFEALASIFFGFELFLSLQ